MTISTNTPGKVLTGGQATPVPPLPVVRIAALAIAVFFLAALCGVFATRTLGQLNPALYGPAAGLVSVVLAGNGIALGMLARRARHSRERWQQSQWVTARERAAQARNAGIASTGMSIIATLFFLTVIFVCSNQAAVQRTFFDPAIMALSFAEVTKALGINILIAVSAMVLAIIAGLGLAIMRLLPGPGMKALRVIAIAVIDIFRSLPAIVVIYLVCFGLPLTRIPVLSQQDPVLYAILALTLVYAAYLAELFRSGIEAIHGSQHCAALSLGLGPAAVYRMVIIPQMARNIAPPLLGYFIGLQKDTALVNVVGIIDAFTQAKIYSSNYYNLSSVTVVCILFIVLTIPQTRFVDFLIARSDSKKTR